MLSTPGQLATKAIANIESEAMFVFNMETLEGQTATSIIHQMWKLPAATNSQLPLPFCNRDRSLPASSTPTKKTVRGKRLPAHFSILYEIAVDRFFRRKCSSSLLVQDSLLIKW